MTRPRGAVALAIVVACVLLGARSASAHGFGGRQDLPLPVWQVVWGAVAAVVISFAALGAAWERPRLAIAAVGRPLPAVAQTCWRVVTGGLRGVVAAVLVLVVAAGWFGSDSPAQNLAPVAVYVIFWVAVALASSVFGDIWAEIGPGSWLAGRAARYDTRADTCTDWPGVVGIAAFAWLELAYESASSPRAVALFVTAYTVFMISGIARNGSRWAAHGDGFAVLFRLIGNIAPVGRDDSGRLILRPPFSGLAKAEVRPGTVAVVLVALGATSFDGVTRTAVWSNIAGNPVGWTRTGIATIGLVWSIAVVSALYLGACYVVSRITGQDRDVVANRFAPALVPIALAYAVAHYFSLLVFEGQNFLIQLSDPFGRGWDLLGTATDRVDYFVISPATIAWAQAGSIVVGHIAGVAVSHDQAVTDYRGPVAMRSQYPLLFAMIVLTISGLLLLFSG